MSQPKVFLDYTQAELDRAYDQRAWAPTREDDLARHAAASAALRQRLSHRADVAYGSTAEETLDIFPAATSGAPVMVFVHGGAWRRRMKEEIHFLATPFVEAGAMFVAVGFAVIPTVRLPGMVEQVGRAVAWVARHAANFGGDPDRIHLAGHSSGAHLTAVLLTEDWSRRFDVPNDVIKSGLCASGMYDLGPVLLSARSSYVMLSAEEIEALSPERHVERVRCPVVVAYGEGESPEFQRQARDFAAALKAAGRPVEVLRADGVNHFEMLDLLGTSDGMLARAAIDQMGLA